MSYADTGTAILPSHRNVSVTLRVEVYQDGLDTTRPMMETRTVAFKVPKTVGRRGIALKILSAECVKPLLGLSIANELSVGILLRQTRESIARDPIALYAVAPTRATQDTPFDMDTADDPPADADVLPSAPHSNEVLIAEMTDVEASDVLSRPPLGQRVEWHDIMDGEKFARPFGMASYRSWRLVIHRQKVQLCGGLQLKSALPKYLVRVEVVMHSHKEIWHAEFPTLQTAARCREILHADPIVFSWIRDRLFATSATKYSVATLQKVAATMSNDPHRATFPSGFEEILKSVNMLQFGEWELVDHGARTGFFNAFTAKLKEIWTFDAGEGASPPLGLVE